MLACRLINSTNRCYTTKPLYGTSRIQTLPYLLRNPAGFLLRTASLNHKSATHGNPAHVKNKNKNKNKNSRAENLKVWNMHARSRANIDTHARARAHADTHTIQGWDGDPQTAFSNRHAPFWNPGSCAQLCKPRPRMIIWYAIVKRYWPTRVSFRIN